MLHILYKTNHFVHILCNFAESLDFIQLEDVFINITYANQNVEQCLNISEYIIDDNVTEEIEYFNLTLSTVQTSFPVNQLIFDRSVAQIFIVDDDMAGKSKKISATS